VEIRSRLTKDITLNIPMLSAAMDTVTDATLAMALAVKAVSAFSIRI